MDQIYVFLYGDNNSEVAFRYALAFMLFILCVVCVDSKKWASIVFSMAVVALFSAGWLHYRSVSSSEEIDGFLLKQNEDVRAEIVKSIKNREYSHDLRGWWLDDNDVGVIRRIHLIDMKIKAIKVVDKKNEEQVLKEQQNQ